MEQLGQSRLAPPMNASMNTAASIQYRVSYQRHRAGGARGSVGEAPQNDKASMLNAAIAENAAVLEKAALHNMEKPGAALASALGALREMAPSDYDDAPGITTQQSNNVQRRVQSLMEEQWEEWFPQVCISYATGTRPGKDDPGAGPGMLQAATITRALHKAGIACASGLCVPSGNDWKDFLPKIDSRFSRCEVLILLLSPAFYNSQPCLLEIHKAAKSVLYSMGGNAQYRLPLPQVACGTEA